MKLWYSFLLACFAQVTSATLLRTERPSADPFYRVPANISAYKVGEVISWRRTPSQIKAVYNSINSKNAWQFLVRSTDGTGNATAIVTTVIEPYNADPRKVLSYQFAEDSADPNCAPSYSMLSGSSSETISIKIEAYFMNPILRRGWYIVAPDYDGPQASFTVGKQGGRATLDSIRAILISEEITGIKADAQVAMWGYSGGSIATGWASQLQPKYAPELEKNLIGAAVGGWCTNLTATVEACDGTIFAGLIANGINGLLNQYSWVKDQVYDMIGFNFRQHFFSGATRECLVGSLLKYPLTHFFGGFFPWFSDGWDFFHNDLIVPLIRDTTLAYEKGDGVPEIPLFVYHGKVDEIIPIVGAERGYNNYCEWGIESMEFAVSNTTTHFMEATEGSGAALKWFDDRFSGKAPVLGCQRTDRHTNLDYPGADLSFYKFVKAALKGKFSQSSFQGYNTSATVPESQSGKFPGFAGIPSSFGAFGWKRDFNEEERVNYDQLVADMIRKKSNEKV